jgi:hypothetical protein
MADLEVNIDDIRKRLPVESDARKAMYSAFTRAVGPSKTTAAKSVTSRYHVTKQQVTKAAQMPNRNRAEPSITLSWKDSQIPIKDIATTFPKTNHRFPARGRANSPKVTSMVLKGGKRTNYTTSFVAQLGKGIGVYRRTTNKRFPIKTVMGPAVPQLMNSVNVQEKIIDRVQPIIDKRLEHEVNRMLNK